MAAGGNETLYLLPGKFVWLYDGERSKTVLLIGPHKHDILPTQRLLKKDPQNPGRLIMLEESEERTTAIQDMITVNEGVEYAVITNPVESLAEGFQNGSWAAGQKDIPSLAFGQARNVTSGYFPVWPGQVVVKHDIIKMAKGEYIIVQVPEPAKVDKKAPFYGVTVQCATKDAPAHEPQKEAHPEEEESETPKTDSLPQAPENFTFSPGQQIRITGVDTEVYIPPTGVDVLPDQSVDASGRPLTRELALDLLERMKEPSAPTLQAAPKDRFRSLVKKGFLGEREISNYLNPDFIRSAKSTYGGEYLATLPDLLDAGMVNKILADPRFEEPKIDPLKGTAGGFTVKELQEAAKGERIVRTALELTETEFAVIIKADGTQRVVAGPRRLFLAPYERFRTAGSNRGVYDAYHPTETQGVLLRVLAKAIKKDDLLKELPPGAEKHLTESSYTIGDEIFIKGLAAYIIPSNNFVICHPKTRTPHMGNDHQGIFVEGIRVDQKSAIYIRNLNTGKVKLEKGETLYIPDPRKEEQVFRRLKSHEWNLWIAATERKPRVPDGQMTDLDWATCIPVQPNEAMLVTGGDKPRIVLGWKRELLEFDESPVTLTLSAGTPKRSKPPVETVILKVADNLVSDRFTITTADNVDYEITLRFKGSFTGETDDERMKWWLKVDYVGELVDFVRSKMRGVTHQKKFVDIKDRMADFVRDTILGVRVEGQGRPGLKMENNFHVTEVMLDDPVILDPEIKKATIEGQRRVVTANLELTTEGAVKEATVALDEIKDHLVTYEKKAIDRENEVETHRLNVGRERSTEAERIRNELANVVATNKQAVLDLEASQNRARLLADSEAEVERIRSKGQVEADALEAKNDVIAEFEKNLTELQVSLIGADAEAREKAFKAMQPELVASIMALGDSNLLAKACENLPPALGGVVSELLKEKGLGAFGEIFNDSRVQNALRGLKDRMDSLGIKRPETR
jgi:hypothetical protein